MALRSIDLTSRAFWVLLAIVLLLAVLLRFCGIDTQSFWNDEGNSARLAERSLDLIVEGAGGDIHPPGYYLVLHYWRALFGQSEAALRGLSALCSVVVVLLSCALALRLLDAKTALLTAALVAVNPFEIYYAQEARMYAMLAMWAVASTLALVVWLWPAEGGKRSQRWALLAYVLLTAAGMYTHYAFPLVMAAQSLFVIAWLYASRKTGNGLRRAAVFGVSLLAVLLLFLPWLPTALRQVTGWSAGAQSYALTNALSDIWRLLNFGHTVQTGAVVGGMVAAAALVVLSLIPPLEQDGPTLGETGFRWRWSLLTLLVIIPTGLILGFGLYKPAYEKFLLVVAAPLSALVALGIVSGWRIATGIGVWGENSGMIGYRAIVLLLVGLFMFDTGRSLYNLYFNDAYHRADYRAIVRHIRDQERPGDAIVLNAPNQWEVFTYYYGDDDNVFPLARQRPLDAAANQVELEQIAQDHQRIFAVFWGDAESDPERVIESWLEAHTYKAGEVWYGDVRLAVYSVPTATADAPEVALQATFSTEANAEAPTIFLDGYTLLSDTVEPGDILQLALFWRAEKPITERYKVFVHLYDEEGSVIAQTDSEPGANLRPTNTWLPGETVIDRYGVSIPQGTPSGSYRLVVGLYSLVDPNHRLEVIRDGRTAGDYIELATIRVSGDAAE